MAMIPEPENRPAALTLWSVSREDGRIVRKRYVVTGPVVFGVIEAPESMRELIEARAFEIPSDQEGASWR